jgi:EIN3-binding F-box protein
MYSFTSNGLIATARNCQLLEELQLCNCRLLPASTIVEMVSSLPHLRELLLVDSWAVSDEVLIAIATHLPKLQHLGLVGCSGGYTEVGALALVTSLTQLQRFCIYANDTTVFTSALRKRWQEVSPGLSIYDTDAVSTQYFERLRC